MSLIKCPDCGKEVSDKAKTCPFCGSPLIQEKLEPTIIKLPFFQNPSKYLKTNAKAVIESNNNVIWEGYTGENASLNLEEKSPIRIVLKNYKIEHYWGKLFLSCLLFAVFFIGFFLLFHWYVKEKTKVDMVIFSGEVLPGKRYELKNIHYGFNYNWKYQLTCVDIIDSID